MLERVRALLDLVGCVCRGRSRESARLVMQAKVGGKLHLKLNIGERQIANKDCEGRMERTSTTCLAPDQDDLPVVLARLLHLIEFTLC